MSIAISGRAGAECILLLVTIIWGGTFPAAHVGAGQVGALLFLVLRFFLATLIFFPIARQHMRQLPRSMLHNTLRQALLLSVINAGGFFLQTKGLETITAGRAGFLTALSVVFVPLTTPFFHKYQISMLDLGAAAVSMVGLAVMTLSRSDSALLFDVSRGDLYIIASAFLFTAHIQTTQKLTYQISSSASICLAWSQIAFMSLIYLMSYTLTEKMPDNISSLFSVQMILSLLYCAICATFTTTYCQVRFQSKTTAERAALIYSCEPIFAAILGFLILNERLSVYTCIGGLLMTFSIIGSESIRLIMFRKKDATRGDTHLDSVTSEEGN